MSQTNEHAFENYVEEILLTRSGWHAGSRADWDKERALFPAQIFAFLQATQGKDWAEMKALHADGLETLLVNTLVKELEIKGALYVLRHGFKFYGKLFRLAYFKPAHAANPEVLKLFAENRLTVARQIPCHPGDNCTVDFVLAVNGLPVATIELKNPGTGQTWQHAVEQYQQDRDPRAPLFEFKKRALVHFAADTDEIHMTTRLAGEKTFFLPFNRGSHPGDIRCGAGNPQHTSGYRTGYFWEAVLRAESFLDILGHFMFIEKKEEKVEDGRGGHRRELKETMIFPRFHQLDAVRKLVTTAGGEGAGQNYLIQHSAGSGKTNSISWLSHRLASLHDAEDAKVFDCVVVITDRQVLDRQLQDAIYQIEHAQGVVKAIDQDSRQLAEALIDGTKIVITTLQKFPFVLRGLLHATGAESQEKATEEEKQQAKKWEAEIAKRRYAIIVDEAHSSQTGETARELKAILGASAQSANGEDEPDWEDVRNQIMQSRGRQPNLSFFAFTATPKGKTLELFGRTGASGLPEPIHLYSMRQAIEEGFILDVVRNYTNYATYFRLVKAVEDDPNLPKKKAARALAKFMSLHPHNIEQKTEVMVEHFRQKVRTHLGGRAKAMVVTSTRLHAVRYMQAFERYIAENKYTDIRPLVAFSGTVKDPDTGLEYTEPGMNTDCVSGKPISEKQLPERFASPDYQVLLVANKYQTGFDQPLLCAMYVDKRLDGVQAVQTLSRLNRKIPGKETPFVLDFVNDAEDIYKAFKPYYDATSLQDASDPQQLETLKHELDAAQVYHWSEVEAFARVFYKLPARQMAQDHARLQRHLQPSVDRFKALEDDDRRNEFREKLKGFVHIYSFLSQVIPYSDPQLEMLYSFGRLLLPHLPLEGETERVKLGDEVDLEYYRLQRIYSGEIDLNEGDAEGVKSPTDVGTGKAKEEKAPLSEIIEVLNERFGTNFSEEDRLFFEQIKEKAVKNPKFIDTALSNPLDKFQLGIKKLLESLMIERLGENDDIVTRYMEDGAFQGAAFPILAKEIFDKIQANAGRQTIEQLVAAGENNTVEFKSTLRVNLHTGQPDPKMEHSALKTIAAFLNSREGGTLVIGVNDDGVAFGVETDKFPNEDKMNLHLGNLIKTRLGTSSMLNIKPHFESFQEKRVLVVDCAPSGVPIYYKDGKDEEFFIRAGASTAALPPSETGVYIKQRFS
ncbi:MAG: putative DNA binding domain-containing protein [Acidobacteria bacterium]|nr:putative DNA binding domain-containing protein [Acidobacteriota bacterium]